MFLLFCGACLVFLYLFVRLTCGISRSSACLVGKTAIITGANSGIGYQTALNLASRGCRVIMADVAEMEASKLNIVKYTNNENIITKKLDLACLKSVREFASDVIKTEERLDILINNAGIGMSAQNRTEDGLHPMMQINYLGHFLLTHLLIDLLKKSAPSRIVFTSSILAFTNNLSLDNLNFDERLGSNFHKLWGGCFLYGNSKLATVIASDIFAEKLKGTGVTSNSLHPGFVATPIFAKTFTNIIVFSFIRCVAALFSKDAWEGSQTLVRVAVSKKLASTSGKFFSDCRPFPKPWSAYDKKWCKEIWEASEKFVGLEEHERL